MRRVWIEACSKRSALPIGTMRCFSRVGAAPAVAAAVPTLRAPRATWTAPSVQLGQQKRWHVAGVSPAVIDLTTLNFEQEVARDPTPIMILAHSPNIEKVRDYKDTVKGQVEKANREAGKTLVRLGLVNVEKEVAIAQQFGVGGPGTFPAMFFAANGSLLDKAVGILPEATVREAIDQFIIVYEKMNKDMKERSDANPISEGPEGMNRMADDEENPMTLLKRGLEILRDSGNNNKPQDLPKAYKMFQKAYDQAEVAMTEEKKAMFLDKKRMTPEMEEKLKKNPHYRIGPSALGGMAMVELGNRNPEAAHAIVVKLREKYPWAAKDMKEIAEAVCKVEMVYLTGFDPTNMNFINLQVVEEAESNPDEFYDRHIKIAVAFWMEQARQSSINELLKLIRAEPKLGKAPKAQGETTLARTLIFLIFDAMGNDHEAVIQARKRMQAFMFT